MAASEGKIIGGKYRLRSRIGEGAMGVVWSAVCSLRDLRPSRRAMAAFASRPS